MSGRLCLNHRSEMNKLCKISTYSPLKLWIALVFIDIMNFRWILITRELVSGLFLRQRWDGVDGEIYFTETYYKMHCSTMGYTTPPPKKILKLYKNKCLTGSWSLDFSAKGYKTFGWNHRTFDTRWISLYREDDNNYYFHNNFWL